MGALGEVFHHNMGMRHPSMPEASLDSYGNNIVLADVIDKIAQKLDGTSFHPQFGSDDYKFKAVFQRS